MDEEVGRFSCMSRSGIPPFCYGMVYSGKAVPFIYED